MQEVICSNCHRIGNPDDHGNCFYCGSIAVANAAILQDKLPEEPKIEEDKLNSNYTKEIKEEEK